MQPAGKIPAGSVRSRLAPTPSGFLHAGNAVNFVITAALTRGLGGDLRLRIDDLDTERVRPEYIEDIFATLAWLGIVPDCGPKNAAEADEFSQERRISRYDEMIRMLVATGRVYGCTCSRGEIQQRTGGLSYDGYCREANNPLNPGTLRFRLDSGTGDPVIRRRDGLPAYHIASLADDIDYGINLIVRGEDLRSSTEIQLAIAQALGVVALGFSNARFFHHPLLKRDDGEKFSKSQADSPLGEWRELAKPSVIIQAAETLLGETLNQFTARFRLSIGADESPPQ